jgi:hypothetical protein
VLSHIDWPWTLYLGNETVLLCRTLLAIRRGLDWIIGFISLIYSWLVTTSNYSATANLHTLLITTVPAKPFPACCVFTSRTLATASNSGHSSASRADVAPSPTLAQNCLPAIPSTELDRYIFSASPAEISCTQHYQTSTLFIYNHFAWTEYITLFPTIPLFLLEYSLPRERVYRSVA